jgi:hypothetical protein
MQRLQIAFQAWPVMSQSSMMMGIGTPISQRQPDRIWIPFALFIKRDGAKSVAHCLGELERRRRPGVIPSTQYRAQRGSP